MQLMCISFCMSLQTAELVRTVTFISYTLHLPFKLNMFATKRNIIKELLQLMKLRIQQTSWLHCASITSNILLSN